MKKILCTILSLVLLFSLVACGNKAEDVLHTFSSFDISDTQGKIKDVFYTLDYTVLNVDGQMREYDPYAEELKYISYDLGDCKDIVVYSDDVVVVEQKDGNIKSIIVIRDTDNMTCVTHEIKYDVTAKDFAYAGFYSYEDEELVLMAYGNDGDYKYYIHDLEGTEINKGDLNDLLDEDEDFEIKEIVYTSFGDAYALNANKEIRGLDFSGDTIYLYDSGSASIEEIDKWISIEFTVDVLVTHKNDDKTIYCYYRDDETYNQTGKIELPKSYKTSNIKSTLNLYNALFVEFDDGEYYACIYETDIETNKITGDIKWQKLDDLKKAAGDGELIEIAGQLCVLKEGKLYNYIVKE